MDKQQQPQQQSKAATTKHETRCDKAAAALSITAPSATATAASTEENRQLVVIAKHLCGAGTDLALKSLEPIRTKFRRASWQPVVMGPVPGTTMWVETIYVKP
jgi:hypothetical protein